MDVLMLVYGLLMFACAAVAAGAILGLLKAGRPGPHLATSGAIGCAMRRENLAS